MKQVMMLEDIMVLIGQEVVHLGIVIVLTSRALAIRGSFVVVSTAVVRLLVPSPSTTLMGTWTFTTVFVRWW